MSLPTIAVSVSERKLLALTISHPLWPSPLRYVNDTRNWTLGGVEYPGLPLDTTAGASDDDGGDTRATALPDPDLELWQRCQDVIGELDVDGLPIPIVATVREYAESNTVTPLRTAVFELINPRCDGVGVDFTLARPDLANRRAPVIRYTTLSNPGLDR